MSNLSYATTAGIIMTIVVLSVFSASKVASTRIPTPAPIIIVPPDIVPDLEVDLHEPYGIIEE